MEGVKGSIRQRGSGPSESKVSIRSSAPSQQVRGCVVSGHLWSMGFNVGTETPGVAVTMSDPRRDGQMAMTLKIRISMVYGDAPQR